MANLALGLDPLFITPLGASDRTLASGAAGTGAGTGAFAGTAVDVHIRLTLT